MNIVTCTAPVNIAVIKYWGKRDETLILPINDSISVTLSSDQMHAKTTVAASPNFTKDRMWLNGKEESMDSPRLTNCLREVKERAKKKIGPDSDLFKWKIHICSMNNFPTAAGLASSAAGYACLVSALSHLYGISDENISDLARQGSGSACRSVYGGFVQWQMGQNPDGSDSLAVQLKPREHWPEMRALILVANDSRKKVPSSLGMRLSVETSELLRYRAEQIVPERTRRMQRAIEEKDFQAFAELTIKDSNQLHAVCQDTFPPCTYMTQTSHIVAALVHKINEVAGKYVVAYTFDAGPNACLFLTEDRVPFVLGLVKSIFPPHPDQPVHDFVRGPSVPEPDVEHICPFKEAIQRDFDTFWGAIKYIIHTSVGNGPELLAGQDQHLLNQEGLPL